MSLVPRAGAIRDTNGLIKMVADARTEEVLGIAMVGNGAAEVIHEAAMGLRLHAKINDFIGVTCRFVKNCTLRKGRGRCKGGPEWSQLPISQAAVATPMVVAGQVDVFPFQR